MRTLLPAVKFASKVARVLGFLGNRKAAEFKAEVDDLLTQTAMLDVPDRFNSAFREHGWIATNSFPLEMMAEAAELHAGGMLEAAEEAIISWFDEDKISFFCIQRTRRFHEADLRTEQLEEALALYQEERYFAAVPLILIACDGLASDVVGYSPFKSGADLSCFDSIVGHESALPALIQQLTTGVRKSSNTSLKLPNRNGILHGRSLGYANKKMCAKAWMLYLAIADWSADKASENERKSKYEKEQNVTFRDTLNLLAKNRRDRQVIDSFESTDKTPPFEGIASPETPEFCFDQFCNAWKQKKFGIMARHAMVSDSVTINKFAGEIREMAQLAELRDYEILCVRHVTVARAEASIRIFASVWRGEVKGVLNVLAFRRSREGKVVMPDEDGYWQVQQNCIYQVNSLFKENDED